MQKTLGGDRLGSGKKIQVNLHGYERSTHDLGYLWRSTMSAGTLVPFLCEVALPGDTFDINLEVDIKTHPTIGPLFGSYKIQLDLFQAPIRLYNSELHNNALNIGRNMAAIKLPQIRMKAKPLLTPTTSTDIDNSQINPSSILAYLGLRGIGMTGTEQPRDFNAVPLIAYWDIYKNYYANKQEEIGMVIHNVGTALVNTVDNIVVDNNATTLVIAEAPATDTAAILQAGTIIYIAFTGAQPLPSQIMAITNIHGVISMEELATNWRLDIPGTLRGNYINNGTDLITQWRMRNANDPVNTAPQVTQFLLTNIDDMRKAILAWQTPDAFTITNIFPTGEPYRWLTDNSDGTPNIMCSQEGLALKTYQSDLFNNWLETEWIDGTGGITEITSIDTTGGSFSIDTLNLSKKVYDMLNRIAVSGGSYDDWLDAVYAHDRYQRCETPMYMGGLIRELVFQEVVSNSESTGSESGTQPLGTLAGKGILGKKKKGGQATIKVDEPSYILGLISLTPRVDYSQGNKWDVNLKTMDDLHKPALDEIGFQELITEQMAWWDTKYIGAEWVQKSAGKQPAWINYMTNVNTVRGNFAIESNEMFMTLNRRYETDFDGTSFLDLTTYIDPTKFNFIFANTAIDAQNFWAQIAVDITARRKMSAKLMPNL